MDWSNLRDFLVVAEQGSISAAARALKASQPALSRRIQHLEESLDVALFVRTQRGLNLTAAGDRVSGVVRISAPEARLGTEWLPRALLSLRQSHPELVIEIVVENQLADLARRAADIAIRAVRPKDPALFARKVAKVNWGLYAAK